MAASLFFKQDNMAPWRGGSIDINQTRSRRALIIEHLGASTEPPPERSHVKWHVITACRAMQLPTGRFASDQWLAAREHVCASDANHSTISSGTTLRTQMRALRAQMQWRRGSTARRTGYRNFNPLVSAEIQTASNVRVLSAGI